MKLPPSKAAVVRAGLLLAALLLAMSGCAACSAGGNEASEPSAALASSPSAAAPNAAAPTPEKAAQPLDDQDRVKQDNCRTLQVPAGGKLRVSVTLDVAKADDAETAKARSELLAKLPAGDNTPAQTYMNLLELDVSAEGLQALCSSKLAKMVQVPEVAHPL